MLPFLVAGPLLAASVVEVTLSNSSEVTLSSLFTAADWAGPKLKRVRVPVGVTIGSTHQATPALNCGTGRGGGLEIVLDGNIDGAGGITNGQNGGDSLYVPQGGVVLKGAGNSRPGGGAGGDGGDGGAGLYYSGRTVTEGEFYDGTAGGGTYYVRDGVSGPYGFEWAGGLFAQGFGSPSGMDRGDGWLYYAGTSHGSVFGHNEWAVYRQVTVFDVPNTTAGGAHGAHGRGQGFDGAATSGASGSAGGTNAGAGGAGGAGGAFGASGTAGTNGVDGNNGSHTAGSAAGLSGYGVNGNANIDRTAFTGSVLGRTV